MQGADLSSLLHASLSIWFVLIAIHGNFPPSAFPQNKELRDNKALGNEDWGRSNASLLSPTPMLGAHHANSRSSISLSAMPAQDEALWCAGSPREPFSPAFSVSNHFGLQKGNPFYSPSVTQLQCKEFPNPPHQPYSGSSTPNYSRSSSRGGGPQILRPDESYFDRQVANLVSRKTLPQSSVVSQPSRVGQLPNGRPKTADLGEPESDLTALPPFPTPKDLRSNQWIETR